MENSKTDVVEFALPDAFAPDSLLSEVFTVTTAGLALHSIKMQVISNILQGETPA